MRSNDQFTVLITLGIISTILSVVFSAIIIGQNNRLLKR